MAWMQTHTGIRFELNEPTADMIDVRDIVVSLSRQVRFNGHTEHSYYTAQHSVLVGDMIREAGGSPLEVLAGNLHDGHEAYMSDVPSPLKWALGDAWDAFKLIESGIDCAIADSFHLPVEMFYCDLVKQADASALWHEKHALLEDNGEDWQWDKILQGREILPLPSNYDLTQPWDQDACQMAFSASLMNAMLITDATSS